MKIPMAPSSPPRPPFTSSTSSLSFVPHSLPQSSQLLSPCQTTMQSVRCSGAHCSARVTTTQSATTFARSHACELAGKRALTTSASIRRRKFCSAAIGRSDRVPARQQNEETKERIVLEGNGAEGPTGSRRSASRRETLLLSASSPLLAAIFHFSAEAPPYLGVQKAPPSLALCPSKPECVSTSEEFSDLTKYIPPWTFNPQDGRGRKKPASREQAMGELKEVILSTKPDGYTPTIRKETEDYLLVEYESSIFGLVDDVEFWFPPGNRSLVEYRSSSRIGFGDSANRKRVKVLRQELQKKGWQSVGF